MKEISIDKIKIYEDGSKFNFRYNGIPNKDYNEEKVNELINAFMDKMSLHKDMVRNIKNIRTILKDVEEKLLVVEYVKDYEENNEIVKYDNGKLFAFAFCKKNENSSLLTEISYTPVNGLNASFSRCGEQKDILDLDYTEITEINQLFSDALKHIRTLKNIQPITLNMDDMKLIEIYRLFYNENPNFSQEDINIKIQTMLSILAQFNIYISYIRDYNNYSFGLNAKMPESFLIEQMVDKLFPFGEITTEENPILKEKSQNIIKIVGEAIRKSIGEKDLLESLITISKTIYAGRYDIDENSDVEKLASYPNINLTIKDTEQSVELVRKISKKITEENL